MSPWATPRLTRDPACLTSRRWRQTTWIEPMPKSERKRGGRGGASPGSPPVVPTEAYVAQSRRAVSGSPGRHYHSTLALAATGCHSSGNFHSNLAAVAVSFGRNEQFRPWLTSGAVAPSAARRGRSAGGGQRV